MPGLLDSESQRSRFMARLAKLENSMLALTPYERDFVQNMRDKWDERGAFDTGWSPSVKQWNYLGDLWIKVS